jgi:hypothetical protein
MPRDTVTGIACSTERGSQDGFDVLRLGSQAGFEASFAPQVGMTCCSLRHRGAELVGDRYGLAAYASCGITMGMSLMHPWADRLSSWTYTVCGTTPLLAEDCVAPSPAVPPTSRSNLRSTARPTRDGPDPCPGVAFGAQPPM